MKYYSLVFSLFFSLHTLAQSTLQGSVQDKSGTGVFAANVYCKARPTEGATTDFDGNFRLENVLPSDTLVVSFIGYQTRYLPLDGVSDWANLQVLLKENAQTLSEITVRAKSPISEQFAVTQLSSLDIYMNPIAQADPLKAITALPASTNADEGAAPSLRGSDPDRTRVMLNGVPIYKPVRASQLNNQGFFSLFNPEIIGRQYVYASNPPLTYGNTSAGLVEINTTQKLEENSVQLSTTLASTGVFMSQKLGKKSFVQAYGNLQFSDAFVGIQPNALEAINRFLTKDAGLNFHTKLGEKTTFNSFTYAIDENSDIGVEILTYRDAFVSSNRRIFSVNTLTHLTENGAFYLRSGINRSKESSQFGALDSNTRTRELYSSLDYKHFLGENASVQMGLAHNFRAHQFRDSIPTYYYAWGTDAPSFFNENDIQQHDWQAYAYGNWDISETWAASAGLRSNMPTEEQAYFLSAQAGLRFKPNYKHQFLLSGGQYHNYSTPGFFGQEYQLLQSQQIALDWSYEYQKTRLQAAIYYKNETGNRLLSDFTRSNGVRTFGVEAFLEQELTKYLRLSLSNSFVRQRQIQDGNTYRGAQDFAYFVKAALSYNHPRLFSASAIFVTRPGIAYTSVVGSRYQADLDFYEPTFSPVLYDSSFNAYRRLDISISRYWRFRRSALIPFASITNVFNIQNQREALHSRDYSEVRFDTYQNRTIFFGLVWEWGY